MAKKLSTYLLFIAVFFFASLVGAPRAFAIVELPTELFYNSVVGYYLYGADVSGLFVSQADFSAYKGVYPSTVTNIFNVGGGIAPNYAGCNGNPQSECGVFDIPYLNTQPAGYYWGQWFQGGVPVYYIQFYYDPATATYTRIISVEPVGRIATTTSTGGVADVLVTGYASTSDFVASSTSVVVNYTNAGCSSLSVSAVEAVNGDCNRSYVFPLSSSGAFSVGSTSQFFNYIGTWNWKARLVNAGNSFCLFGICLLDNSVDITTKSGSFIVGTTTAYDNFIVQIASTSQIIPDNLDGCSPLSFEVGSCIISLFVPSSATMSQFMSSYSGEFLQRFPLGYVTDFVRILSSSSTSPLTAIDATIPNGLVGAGSHIRLDLTNVFDPILNATTSNFVNSSAPSTDTFYEITSYYWDIIVYIGLFLYFLRKIIRIRVNI